MSGQQRRKGGAPLYCIVSSARQTCEWQLSQQMLCMRLQYSRFASSTAASHASTALIPAGIRPIFAGSSWMYRVGQPKAMLPSVPT